MPARSPDKNSLVALVESGTAPDHIRLLAARGTAPVGQDELLRMQVLLAGDPLPEVAEAARKSLQETPPLRLMEFVRQPHVTSAELGALAGVAEADPVLEAIARHRNASDETLILLAGRDGATLQEVLVTNQIRLLRNEAILQALERNPSLTLDVRRRAAEFRAEFLVKDGAGLARARAEEIVEDDIVAPSEEDALPEDIIAIFIDTPDDEFTDDIIREIYADEALVFEKRKNLFQRITVMNPAQKIQLALKGNREARGLLIRDSNRLVATSVMKSPKLSEPEVDAISKMKNVNEDVLRILGASREHLKRYTVVLNLIGNSKAPPGMTVPLLSRLSVKDLRGIAKNKGVPEIVRTTAFRMHKAKEK